jgi:hypothetical protein
VHPGYIVPDIVAATGFEFDRSADVPVTAAPTAADLSALRGKVRAELAEVYPKFVQHAFAA